jgi:hypothetical protein
MTQLTLPDPAETTVPAVSTSNELAPGAYAGYPEDLYHKLPYVSSSFLKKFKDCPAAALLEVATTTCMDVGSALHCITLEGEEPFDKRFVVMFESELNKNSNDYKAKAKEFNDKHSGKTILPAVTDKTPTWEVIKGVTKSIKDHPGASDLLSRPGLSEVTLVWDDPVTGLRCKARLDKLAEGGIIADLKKTPDVLKFKNVITSMNYDIQASWYRKGARANELNAERFIFIGMETAPPFMVDTCTISAEWMEDADKETTRLLWLVKECKERNKFPAFHIPKSINSLDEITPGRLMTVYDKPAWR